MEKQELINEIATIEKNLKQPIMYYGSDATVKNAKRELRKLKKELKTK